MKKIFLVSALGFLFACGNRSAENKPTDVDQTKNNDTSAMPKDSSRVMQKDSADTAHLQKP